ncbi:TrkA C-terminal domain-containing protein [Halopiger djelfimassiliensis]|uniref:TrkA C-terminal domain-containing protein n=1 Tax=Halopiger djelfimassiliensis TaxID=1293047 RepID=UPI000AA077AB|nr:TrkA C-terminal domain-containing protein [Halopiger djelfimassiliensis]
MNVPLDHQASAGYLLATFLVGGTVAAAGSRLGDRIACQVTGLSRIDASGEAAAAVRSARLGVDLELPDTIDDAEGYRSVDTDVRRALSKTIVRLPHGLSTAERRERLERHIERDYEVSYADVTMDEDGAVDRVLVGRNSSGLGSMLPPKTVGIAIRGDPAPNASLGDPIEIWSTDGTEEGGQLVATGTLRTTNGSVATVIVDAEHASELSADERYRLVTHPDEPTDGYEFASTLRTADETIITLTVDSDGPLAGEFVGWLPGRVLVLDRNDELFPLPEDNETLQSGDELWLLVTPTDLTAFDSAVTDEISGELM